MKTLSPLVFIITSLMVPVISAASQNWTMVETARDKGHLLSPVDTATVPSVEAAIIALDPTQQFQEIIGFGGALTESSAWVLAQLTPEKCLEVIRRYYDPKEGIGYTLARTHLNSSDFSLSMWALDETPGDYELHDFTLEPMRRWLMPLLHDAAQITGTDCFKLIVSPWSPPAWMKTNFRMDDGGSLWGEYAPSWANYYVKFVEAMRHEENLKVWAFTVQNEPEAKQVWESCLYPPEQERNFVRDHLGPAMERAGLTDVKLIAHDHNRDILEAHADATLGDPATAKYLWGLGLHWYVSNDFEVSSRVHAKYPDKAILFTEGCWEGGKNLGRWEHGEGYARQMIGDMSNWVCGYIDWNIVLDQRGGPNHVGNFCDAPVLVDTNTKEIRYTPAFFYIAHFSKFVIPGAHRIASSGGPAELQSIAFANPDGSLVTIVLNETAAAVAFSLSANGDPRACSIAAHAIQTYVTTLN
jgi:glucosylceramidase|uniref:glycoside hydrolase family 30 protein n=1 Tax=Cephaloticoccus sp. TaxID=1985742 RepID=UPI00404ACFBA